MLIRPARLMAVAVAQLAIAFSSLHAQKPDALAALHAVPQANRVAAHASMSARTTLEHHVPGWVHNAALKAQTVDLSQPMRLTVVLRRDDAVQAAFEQLLADQQNPASPLYHHWLTPAEVGSLYGPTEADLAAVQNWLTSEGLSVDAVQPNRVLLDVSGPVAKVASAFRTQFGYYTLNGQTRMSAGSDPSIPAALSAVVSNISGLTEVRHRPASHVSVRQGALSETAGFQPRFNAGGGVHFLTPGDFNLIYDINPVLNSGNRGATIGASTQSIAIIGRSRVAAQDISYFLKYTNTSANNATVVLAGSDPGTTGDGNQDEATLDVDRVISTAPGVNAELVIAKSDNFSDGVTIASAYNINTRRDPIMTISFGDCEEDAGAADSSMYTKLFSAGAAEGISIFVSAGDSGADGCFSAGSPPVVPNASNYANSNDLCNAYVTCVGGTEFVEGSGSYWSNTNAPGYISALSYIPEGAWNEPTTTDSSGNVVYQMAATGGGPSIYVPKPAWQTGTGVPPGNFRQTPDVALSSSDHDGYFACLSTAGTGNCVPNSQNYFGFVVFSGTSAAAPGMAAIAALVNTRLGTAQGFLNPLLYRIANTASTANAFHDATPASSGVGSFCSVNVASVCNNSTPGPGSLTGGIPGFGLTTGYDDATGLGSLDVANFLAAVAAPATATATTVTAAPSPATVGAQVTLSAAVAPSTSGSNAASGTVSFSYTLNGGASVAIGAAQNLSSGSAAVTTSFNAPGTYTITAVYSGDLNFATSTGTTSLTVNASSFTITPASTSLPTSGVLVSGSSVNDAITVASANSFAGTVNLTCAVARPSATETAAGTCSLAPTSGTLTANGSFNSNLTVATTPGTSGTLTVVITGTSGTTTVMSSTITLLLTAPSFTVTATPAAISAVSGGTAASTLTITSVNGFSGTVTLGGLLTLPTTVGNTANGTYSISPTSVTISPTSPATATASVATTAGGVGTLNFNVTGTGTTAGSSIPSINGCGGSTTPCIVVTETTPFTATATPATVSLVPGVTNATATVTYTSANGYSGTFTPVCTSPAASCTFTPATITLSAGGSASTTAKLGLSAGTTAPVTEVFGGLLSGTTNTLTTASVTITPTAPFTLTVTPATLSFLSGATTGNTATVTVSAAAAFAGTVNLTCGLSAGTAAFTPSCSVTPGSVTLTSGGTATAVATISSTTATTSSFGLEWRLTALVSIVLAGFGLRRRKALGGLMMFFALAFGITMMTGCGSGTAPKTFRSSAGAYTATVTATTTIGGVASSQVTTFTVNIQ